MDRECHPEATPYYAMSAHRFLPPKEPSKFMFFCNFIYNLFLLVGLVIIICVVLEYHCTTCEAKCNMNALSKNIEDIAHNLALMEKNYHELETQISQFSRDLPKIEGQLELLEALATMEQRQCRFKILEPHNQWCLPNVDVNLAQGDGNINTMDTNMTPKPENFTSSIVQ